MSCTADTCQNFVQNTWKKDLCSNCFKLKVEHKTSHTNVEEINLESNSIHNSEEDSSNLNSNGDRSLFLLQNAERQTTITESAAFNVRSSSAETFNGSSSHCTYKSKNYVCEMNNGVKNNKNVVKSTLIKNGSTNSSSKLSSPRKIGSNGALLWEVGRSVKKNEANGSSQEVTAATSKTNGISNGFNGVKKETGENAAGICETACHNNLYKVQGILKETVTVNGTNNSPKQNGITIPIQNLTSDRRGSVGFAEESPQVIGYGGNDYEWDDQESSDEPSDVDSLENFDMSEEDKAFNQLTDKNTEFNADNSNLLMEHNVSKPTMINSPPHTQANTSLAAKLTPINFYSVPSKVVSRLSNGAALPPPPPPPLPSSFVPQQPRPLSPPQSSFSSADAQEFIRNNLYSSSPVNTSDTEDFLDAEDIPEVSNVVAEGNCIPENDSKWDEEKQQMASPYRIGFQSVPIRRCSSPVSRVSVQQLFREEPVTAMERQEALKRNSVPISVEKCNGDLNQKKPHEASPYGIVSISSIPNGCENGFKKAPQIPSCPPPSTDDQKLPIKGKLHNSNNNAWTKPDSCSSPKSNLASQFSASPNKNHNSNNDNDLRKPFIQREYASVNHSCHYASSFVTVESSSPSSPQSSCLDSSRCQSTNSKSKTPVQLPPTPLTNPYSSTAILKGIPQTSPDSTPAKEGGGSKSPQKPPVTKPKPKLPVKPQLQQKQQEETPTAVNTTINNAEHDHLSLFEITATFNGNQYPNANDAPGVQNNILPNGNRTSVLYQEIDEDINTDLLAPVDQSEELSLDNNREQIQRSFESKAFSQSNLLDHNRRVTKRQAPKPPQVQSSSHIANGSPSQRDHQELTNDSVTLRNNKMYSSVISSSPKQSTVDHASSPSPKKTSVTSMAPSDRSSCHSLTESRTSMSSLDSNSFKSTSSANSHSLGYNQKEIKSKKSKFSLRKLLRFGKDDHDEVKLHKGKGLQFEGVERKGKLEIIHPLDLMQNNEADAKSNSSSNQNNGNIDDIIRATEKEEQSSTVQYEENVNQKNSAHTEFSESWSEEAKPPPPRRLRSHGDDHSKEKPLRPPPPAKHSPVRNSTKNYAESCETDQTKSFASNTEDASDTSAKRISFYGPTMEYANLGDVRNSFVPKKPGRCTSSMSDISAVPDGGNNVEIMSASHEILHAANTKDCCHFTGTVSKAHVSEDVVTYYAPTEEIWPTEDVQDDVDDLYADQGVINTSSDTSQPSSFVSDSLSTNSSNSKHATDSDQKWNGLGQNDSVSVNSGTTTNGSKIYERVVLKRGSLEKVYAKLPIVSSTMLESCTTNSSSSCALMDVDEGDLGANVSWPRRKSSRLSLRKSKSVVHKNLEDNYDAVVSANHQTLTQILEQVSLSQHTTPSKIKHLEDIPLHWTDFTLLEDSQVTMVGNMAFYSATWQQSMDVTLMVTSAPPNSALQSSRNPCALIPAVEFEDDIPSSFLTGHLENATDEKLSRGTIWVMERMRVETLDSVADALHLQAASDVDASEREVCFLLLQLINGFKHLQVVGIEEVNGTMDDFLLSMKNNDTNYRFVILCQGANSTSMVSTDASVQEQKLSLCQCALVIMLLLLHVDNPVHLVTSADVQLEDLIHLSSRHAFRIIGNILKQERATSLSQAKLLLEYMIWGPTEIHLDASKHAEDGSNGDNYEKAYQRWLDLERATVLNNLIRTQSLWQIRLTVFEEYMLSFLVRTCAKTLHDAALQLQLTSK